MQSIISFFQIAGITGDSVVLVFLAIILLLSMKLMLHGEFKENNAIIDKKFDKVYEKFDAIDNKFDAIDNKFDKKFDGIDKKFDKVYEKFDAIDNKFDNVNKKSDDTNQKFENIHGKVSKVEGELSTLFVLVKEKGFLKSQSPLQLSDEGEKFKEKIHADVIFERNKRKLINYMKFPYSNDYEIQEDAFYFISQEDFEKVLEKKELDEIKQAAYQEGQTLGETLMVFKVLLRDYSIDYNKKLKKLQNLLAELRNLAGISSMEQIHVRDEFWSKISALDKKEKEAMASILTKLEMEMEANKITKGIAHTVAHAMNESPAGVVGSEYLDKAEEFYNFLIDTVKTN